MDGRKRIALTAHDAAKANLVAWAFANERTLSAHALSATGNTGRLLMEGTRMRFDCLRSGALGGDLELGALLVEGRIDVLVFFMDPLTRQPHDIDPAPLIRAASLGAAALALNETTADFLIRSELLARPYSRTRQTPALPPATHRIEPRREVA